MAFRDLEERLHEEAVGEVGFDDFGEGSYLEGLRVVLDAYDREAKFTPAGREMARRNLVQLLAARLRANRRLKENPDCLGATISRPIVVLGLVRTGSTALHHLLAQNPDTQVLEYWLACHPRPRPPRERWAGELEFQESVQELDAMYAADPSLKAIHFMAADGPEECRHFLAQSFTDDSFEVNATVPSYTRWYESKQIEDSYRRHRDLLCLVGANDPERRWVLKYPVHMKNLRALLEVYPDACIVQTHRDPSEVLSSYVSLISGFRALYEDGIDREAIGKEQLEVWACGAEQAIEVRREHDPSRFHDLHFHDFMADPVGSVKRIYERFGVALSEEAERRLVGRQRSEPRGKHGEHRHSIVDVPISRGEILDRFAGYMKHFGMTPERPA